VEKQSCRAGCARSKFLQPIAFQNPPQAVLMIHAIGKGLEVFVRSSLRGRPASQAVAKQASPWTGGGNSTKHWNASPLSGCGGIDIGHAVCACGGLHGTAATCISTTCIYTTCLAAFEPWCGTKSFPRGCRNALTDRLQEIGHCSKCSQDTTMLCRKRLGFRCSTCPMWTAHLHHLP
jgi:hypothetical protein